MNVKDQLNGQHVLIPTYRLNMSTACDSQHNTTPAACQKPDLHQFKATKLPGQVKENRMCVNSSPLTFSLSLNANSGPLYESLVCLVCPHHPSLIYSISCVFTLCTYLPDFLLCCLNYNYSHQRSLPRGQLQIWVELQYKVIVQMKMSLKMGYVVQLYLLLGNT